MLTREEKIDTIFQGVTDSKQIYNGILLVENTKGDFSYSKLYGECALDEPFLMASVTKLFTTSCILILKEQGRLSLQDKISDHLDNEILRGLHIYKGQEYSLDLTIEHLLFQNSGLADLFEEGSNSLLEQLTKEDIEMPFEKMLTLSKQLEAHFKPGHEKKAFYADINFELLGKIIETLMEMPFAKVCEKLIFEPLGLKDTYLVDEHATNVPKVYYKDQLIDRTRYLSNCHASGGGVSTVKDLMIFIKAFIGGDLFNLSQIEALSHYRKLQITKGPIYYGGGFMQIPLGGLMTMFQGKGELIGHSGVSGSFAFYCKEKDLFMVGTVNQLAAPSIPIKLIMQLAMSIR
ncbi:MAG: beta-lactamase family protein [Cellulosilyticum sp.]|nr:beta-lactamase family protein [Cellulosilyticum sp.]